VISRTPVPWLCASVFLLAGLAFQAVRVRYLGLAGDAPWDAGWYHSIARDGYTFDGDLTAERNVAFFPLHPFVVRWLVAATGAPIWATQTAVSIAFSAAGGFLLARALLPSLAPRYVAMGAFLIAFSPFAIYLYNGYSESAYFFAVCLLMYALRERPRLALAALAVILASLARPWGILTGAVLAVCLLYRHGRDDGPSLPAIVLTLCAASLGFIGITMYFDARFGDPLLFIHATSVWDRTTTSFRSSVLTAQGIFEGLSRFRESASNSLAVGVVLYLVAIAVTALARRWLPRDWFVLVAFHAVAFYFLTYRSPHAVLNAGRYSLLLFPAAFYALAVFRRIDVALGPADLPRTGNAVRPTRAFEGEPLPVLGYLVVPLFVVLFLRYAADFVQYRWVS
jgi:hypothetical protein